MSLYAVQYTYSDDSALRDEHRPAHCAYLRGLFDEETLVASGPLSGDGALLIIRAASEDAALAALNGDPFLTVGAIKERTAREWTVVLGSGALTGE